MKILVLTPQFDCLFVQKLKSSSYEVTVSYDYEEISENIDLVFVHNYDKIIPERFFNTPRLGIFVIHSSDLPKGRGWAPIYYSIAQKDIFYTVTLLKVSKRVDEGDIFMKLRIKKPKFISNNNLRDIDEEATYFLVKRFIDFCLKEKKVLDIKGVEQEHLKATYNKRRIKSDNLLDKNKNIGELIYKILATNEDYPAFIDIGGERIFISAKTEKKYFLNELEYKIDYFCK